MSMTCGLGAYPAIVKSLNDEREYRLITLDNGLRALLVSDLTGYIYGSDEDDSDWSEESYLSTEDAELDKDIHHYLGLKSAAALCVGVGSFSDPDDIPGFAHFLERMVLTERETYPLEKGFCYKINNCGGSTDARTDCERTVFSFDVGRKHFRKSLDIFAKCFMSPHFLDENVEREVEEVNLGQ
ncbi:hypothetical protein CHS0354_015657 [Potamilus streckersoni]|uniref:Peptidase M16 N-terminal domain-containing protein n=1 Tax=Potamilus streckersoni TaxID=2493646 RepID=A0AAE0SI87_9BIVA|nr:hypothetical protein CHS0354_015657 [Potamilus streckersoni]